MQTSAMVTAEWTMRNMFFGKWGFPFEMAANLYQRLGRPEEARDTARLALKQPWWTISDLDGCAPRRSHGTRGLNVFMFLLYGNVFIHC